MEEIISNVLSAAEFQTYIFGSEENRADLLDDLISGLSQPSFALNPVEFPQHSFLRGHPKRLLTLDEISAIRLSDLCISEILEVSGDILLEETFASQSNSYDQGVSLEKLAHHFMKRYWRFAETFDLNEAIYHYQEALSMFHKSDCHYVEVVLGLCSAFYHRLQLFGRKTDLQHLLMYLRLQRSVEMPHPQLVFRLTNLGTLAPPNQIFDPNPLTLPDSKRSELSSYFAWPRSLEAVHTMPNISNINTSFVCCFFRCSPSSAILTTSFSVPSPHTS